MGVLNPYDTFLDGRPVLEILEKTPGTLDALIASVGAENASKAPSPGKWSPAEIVAHLADCEVVFAFRLRQTLAEDDYTIQPFDQGKWGEQYAGVPVAQALEVFKAMRGWNLRLLRGVGPEAAGRRVTHPERGAMTFQIIVETMAGHDLNHVSQLERIAGKSR